MVSRRAELSGHARPRPHDLLLAASPVSAAVIQDDILTENFIYTPDPSMPDNGGTKDGQG